MRTPSTNIKPRGGMTRRSFMKTGAMGLTALSSTRVAGASETISVGVIGVGLIGRILTRGLAAQTDVRIAGIAETYVPRLEVGVQLSGGRASRYRDFRKMLDSKDLDAVVVATPDHWHGLMTMLACAAGKDVYVEKPFSLFVKEGRWMVEAARRYKRIVQVGTQNRSGPNFGRARNFIQAGKLGEIISIQANYFRNLMPGLGSPPDEEPPPEFDWEMFQGPAPARPYNPLRGIYNFRWFWDTSGGQMTNLGQHSQDLVHWFMNVEAPKSAYSLGGRRYLKDICETPDTQDVIFEYPGLQVVCQYREATAGRSGVGMGGLVFYGTRGSMRVGRDGYEVFPDPKRHPINTFANIIGGHPVGGPQPVPEEKGQKWTTKVQDDTGDAPGDYVRHLRNFLDCVKSREDPAVNAETGHRVATSCHLANISLRTGRKVEWDAETEKVANDAELNRWLVREYRAPWDREFRALGIE